MAAASRPSRFRPLAAARSPRRYLTLLTERPLSINGHPHAGLVLLVLDALLLAAMWPIVGAFVFAVVACGLVAGAMLRRWNDAHPATQEDRSWSPRKLPEINIASVNVGGDVGGFLFLCATVLAVIVGLPSVRWFAVAALAAAILSATVLVARRREHVYSQAATSIAK
jgi:hypothetical protein